MQGLFASSHQARTCWRWSEYLGISMQEIRWWKGSVLTCSPFWDVIKQRVFARPRNIRSSANIKFPAIWLVDGHEHVTLLTHCGFYSSSKNDVWVTILCSGKFRIGPQVDQESGGLGLKKIGFKVALYLENRYQRYWHKWFTASLYDNQRSKTDFLRLMKSSFCYKMITWILLRIERGECV